MGAAQSQRYDIVRPRDRASARSGMTLIVYALMLAIMVAFGSGPLAQIEAEDALNTILITPPKPPAPPPTAPAALAPGGRFSQAEQAGTRSPRWCLKRRHRPSSHRS